VLLLSRKQLASTDRRVKGIVTSLGRGLRARWLVLSGYRRKGRGIVAASQVEPPFPI